LAVDLWFLNSLILDGHKQNTISILQSLKEERAHIEEYLQNAAAKKKELDKELNASFSRCNKSNQF
jgi:hypothetical protein